MQATDISVFLEKVALLGLPQASEFAYPVYHDRGQEFWSQGRYMDTTGVKDASRMEAHLFKQLNENVLGEQITMNERGPVADGK